MRSNFLLQSLSHALIGTFAGLISKSENTFQMETPTPIASYGQPLEISDNPVLYFPHTNRMPFREAVTRDKDRTPKIGCRLTIEQSREEFRLICQHADNTLNSLQHADCELSLVMPYIFPSNLISHSEESYFAFRRISSAQYFFRHENIICTSSPSQALWLHVESSL